jgi:hypothetical protein
MVPWFLRSGPEERLFFPFLRRIPDELFSDFAMVADCRPGIAVHNSSGGGKG